MLHIVFPYRESIGMAISKPPTKPSAVDRFASAATRKEQPENSRRSVLLSLPADLVERIDELAKRRYLSRTALITVFMTEGLERAERGIAA